MTYGTIEVELNEETVAALTELADRCNSCGAIGDGFASHGASFSVATLLALFAEDAGKIISDPESWQSANMRQVLAGHGYLVGRRVQ